MRHRLYSFLFILLLSAKVSSYAATPTVNFSPTISLKGFSSATSEKGIENSDFESGSAMFELPVSVLFNDSLYLDLNFFARSVYNNSYEDKSIYKYNFQKANLNFKTDNILLKAGRQDYQEHTKNLVIYYGPHTNTIDVGPTAIDGIRHSLKLGVFYYDLLLAKESPALFYEYPRSTVGGGIIGLDIKKVFNFDVFFFKKHGKVDQYKWTSDTIIYGATTGFYLEKVDAFVTAAFSRNEDKTTPALMSIERKFRGHMISGVINLKNENDFLHTKYRLRMIFTNKTNNADKKYTPISSNADYGFIFSGNATSGFNNLNIIGNTNVAGFSIYNIGAEFRPQALNNLSLALDLYNYQNASNLNNSTDLGYEIDASITYCNPNFNLSLIYGFFNTGNGVVINNQVKSDEKIQKIGLYSRFTFDF